MTDCWEAYKLFVPTEQQVRYQINADNVASSTSYANLAMPQKEQLLCKCQNLVPFFHTSI